MLLLCLHLLDLLGQLLLLLYFLIYNFSMNMCLFYDVLIHNRIYIHLIFGFVEYFYLHNIFVLQIYIQLFGNLHHLNLVLNLLKHLLMKNYIFVLGLYLHMFLFTKLNNNIHLYLLALFPSMMNPMHDILLDNVYLCFLFSLLCLYTHFYFLIILLMHHPLYLHL